MYLLVCTYSRHKQAAKLRRLAAKLRRLAAKLRRLAAKLRRLAAKLRATDVSSVRKLCIARNHCVPLISSLPALHFGLNLFLESLHLIEARQVRVPLVLQV
jgi:hypothetical protein